MVPMPQSLTGLTIATAMDLMSCGNETNTGRNADPAKWPTAPQNNSEQNSEQNENPGRGSANQSCFESTTREIPDAIAKICAENIQPEPAYKGLYPIICEQGKVIASFNRPSCGWDGNLQTINRYIHHYYVQPDKTQDYEDLHASFVHAPVPLQKYMFAVRLAFENFDEFKRLGYQWVAGTREHRNLSGTTWEQGVNYRFRVEKEQYDIGYQGYNKLYQISPTLFMHLNHATGDFARIAAFAQIVFYQEQADGSTVSFKIEHRRVSSHGFYDLAKKTSAETVRDVMEKGYRNATKP